MLVENGIGQAFPAVEWKILEGQVSSPVLLPILASCYFHPVKPA